MYENPRLLMCQPTYYHVEYVINPWMDGNIGRTDHGRAQAQWDAYYETVSKRATVELIEPVPELPDMCFVANAGLALGDVFLPARFRFQQREPEVAYYLRWFAQENYRVVPASKGGIFEGEGDALFQPERPLLWCGYGVRTSLETYRDLIDVLRVECAPLRLIDERFYHLDTCFCPLPCGRLIYYPDAFDHASLDRIHARVPQEDRFEVSTEDALNFACNSLWLGDAFITNHASQPLRDRLERWGYETIVRPLDQFMLAGGSAKCLVLRLDHPFPDSAEAPTESARITDRLIRIEGQLLGTGLLNNALDEISDDGGDFRVESLDAGLRRDQPSTVELRVIGTSPSHLDRLVERLVSLGATTREPLNDAHTETVSQSGVAPTRFYSTTIYPTEVRISGEWLLTQDQRMDAVIRIESDEDDYTARCVLIRELQPGDRVICGADGIRVAYPAVFPKTGSFAFMSSGVSSERRVEGAVESVAWEMQRIRDRGGRTVVVAGPVVVHTGGAPYLAGMIRNGYVQALLGGNAIAVHDIERALLGTSLGVDLQRSAAVPGGHRNHLTAINAIRRCGSIADAVEHGVVESGIMYECVTNNIPFSLAGSIRDDGPLPDTQMDLVAAQEAYARLVEGADLILMLASMLHSIGVGNMTPAGVRLVCVDISPAVVTKLADRGSVESTGIVTDTGLFLKLLAERLA